jgi:hypothetical protein
MLPVETSFLSVSHANLMLKDSVNEAKQAGFQIQQTMSLPTSQQN